MGDVSSLALDLSFRCDSTFSSPVPDLVRSPRNLSSSIGGGASLFLVGGVIFLVHSANEQDVTARVLRPLRVDY